jgi:large subunit ribosomal protein L22
MSSYCYTTKAGENEAKAAGVRLPASYKQSYEIAKAIRGKKLSQAKKILEDAIALKRPIPMTRFNTDTGHKHGMAAGRFAPKTCSEILKLLESAESNAQFKGLSTGSLVLRHIAAQRGPTSFRNGRQGRRKFKQAHVEVILSEAKETKTRGTTKTNRSQG